MRTATVVLCVATCAVAVLVDYAPPAASYVYRSDNGGPPSLISLGPAFAAPVPLPYVSAQPLAVEDAEEDAERAHEEDGHEAGGGGNFAEAHRNAHGERGGEGYATRAHHARGVAGRYGDEHREGYYREGEGQKSAHHDRADDHGAHHRAGESSEGGGRGHAKHFSKGEDVTGYHKVFSKDEFEKDHDFYDEAAKDGHFEKHGYHKAHHGAEQGAHAKGGRGAAGSERGAHGRAGFRTAGRVDEADEGHSAEEGADTHHRRHEDYGSKGARHHGRAYAFADGDDGDDDDDGDE